MFAVAARAQVAPATPAPAAVPDPKKVVPVETTAAKPSDEVVALSPFEVVSDTKGYYASTTMSGTRFNSKLEDLASSITVVTKEQMSDFAMLDINDVFLYTAGTEGTGTYTDAVIDRNGSIQDNVMSNPAQANRVRGLAPANVSLGNIETMGRVPVDPIAVDAIEVSRGPNANVFGLGNPSGTVNQVPAAANLTRNRTGLEFRLDALGGFRSSLDQNLVLSKGKLAVRGSAVFQKDEFVRKPSGVKTERYNGMIKYSPFKGTTIAASASYYHSYGVRANALPPRDGLSYWIANGRPTWDPVTQQIHINGVTVATVTAATYNGPDYYSASNLGNNRNNLYIDNGGIQYWASPAGTTSTTNPAGATQQAARYLQLTGYAGAQGTAARPASQPLFATTPTITDKSIYDWSKINLGAPNNLNEQSVTANVQIDHVFINTPRQTLAVQGAFMREDSIRSQVNFLGGANDNGQGGQLTVDINERLLDGKPNPFFLRPYLGAEITRYVDTPAKWDTSRVQGAYRLNLTDEKSLLKWLGWHQLTGYAEYKYRVNQQYSSRDAITNAPWVTPGTYVGNQSQVANTPTLNNLARSYYKFYVGDNKGNNVDYAPSGFKYGTYPFVWGNAATGVFNTENLNFGRVAVTDSTAGSSNVKTVLRTQGGVIQSHFFGDRLVTTFGKRTDHVLTKFGITPVLLKSDGQNYDYGVDNSFETGWRNNQGKTTNVQFVVRPFKEIPALSEWGRTGGDGAHFFAGLLSGFSANFNKADSFLPASPAQDLYRKTLPNPTGNDKSYGFGLNLFDGKLVIRATHYKTAQLQSRNGDANTVNQRVIRTDLPLVNATPGTFMLYNRATDWVTAANPTFTPTQIRTEVARQMGMSIEVIDALSNPVPPIAATNDIISEGNEVEVNINLNKFWTIAASGTKTEARNEHVSSTLADWIAQRMPIWTTIRDQTDGALWWTKNYGGSQTGQQNFVAFVETPYAIIREQEGKANPQVRKYNFRGSTSYQLAGLTENKFLKRMTVGGALRWEDKGAIGYYGVESLPATITRLNPNRPIYDKSHYYVDAFASYRTRLWNNKVGSTFKLNIRNLGETGRLQPIGVFPDGTPHSFRIIDPAQYIFTAAFDL